MLNLNKSPNKNNNVKWWVSIAGAFLITIGTLSHCNKPVDLPLAPPIPPIVVAADDSSISHGSEVGLVLPQDTLTLDVFVEPLKKNQAFSTFSSGPVNATYPTYRSIYLDHSDTIYNNVQGRNAFARYCLNNKFDEVHMYHVSNILQSSSKFPNLATFITLLKNNGVTKVEAVLSTSNTGDFQDYRNYTTSSIQDFTGINLELEYWNGATSFNTWINTLNTINNYCDSKSPDLNCSFYQGWYKNMGGLTDSAVARQQILLSNWVDNHDYQDGKVSYTYGVSRYEALAKAAQALGVIVTVNPIFSVEETAWGASYDFQGNLLKSLGYAAMEKQFIDNYNANASTRVKTWLRIGKCKYFMKRYCYKAVAPI